MVPEKRKLMVVSGAIAAAFALPGCAPAGYNPADYNAGAAPEVQPAANAVEAEAEPAAGSGDDQNGDAGQDEQEEQELTEEELTDELNRKAIPRMGESVTDEDGWVLYRFDKDEPEPPKSNCEGECAEIWPPALTDGEPKLDGVSADDVGTVERADGTTQITLRGWPLYRYVGDTKPGQWKGQNVGGTWFVVKPDGTKNLTCLPKVSKPVAPPSNDDEPAAGDEAADDKAAGDKAAGDKAEGGDAGGDAGGPAYSY